ncbi:MAG TPA: CocE/NonD family hydrolase, partial [Acidimicrobiia bacterium]|nr:CocE/NonD family hydrolase [Acidimicrobiia bacterium]
MRRFGVIACVCLLAVAACSSSNKKSKPSANHVDLGSASAASFTAHGSVGQVYVLGAGKQQTLDLVDGKSDKVATGTTDVGGSLIFRGIAVGTGYRVATSDHAHASAPVDVTAWDAPPPESFYDNQHIENGYGYITMRDGVQLSMTVKLPGPADKGPYPTVVEYSGYSPADPKSPQPSTLITQNLGYATVGVNMRGTGCSGGAFQFFEPLQSTDGYDIIETIAAQPWVKNHMVGMVGISYPGISQLFTAELNPPHLAAIAPLSVIDDTAKGTLAPGGILNSGFAVGWARDREHDSQAAPAGGQQWAIDRVKAGDKTCLANQVLHRQAPNILQTIDDNRYW